MKNKIVFIGSLCLILALGLVFTGCKTEYYPENQEVSFPTIGEPANPSVTFTAPTPSVPSSTTGTVGTSTSGSLTITWEAVDGASGYDFVLSRDGKKTSTYFNTVSQNSTSNPSYSSTTNKWSYTISNLYTLASEPITGGTRYYWDYSGTTQITNGQSFEIGIIAKAPTGKKDLNDSSPAWGGSVSIPARVN